MEKFKTSIDEAIQQLKKETAQKFTVLLRDGNMSVEYFAPYKTDTQKPHSQDELYVIISGSGTFFRDGTRITFKSGDVIFVPAGMIHRFENFTDDFSTWVIFYGEKID